MSTFRSAAWSANVADYGRPTCEGCGVAWTLKNRLKLEAHHVIPLSAGGEDCGIANGALLCVDCHGKEHAGAPARRVPHWLRLFAACAPVLALSGF